MLFIQSEKLKSTDLKLIFFWILSLYGHLIASTYLLSIPNIVYNGANTLNLDNLSCFVSI